MQYRFRELIILGTKKGFMGGRVSFNPKRKDCPVLSVGVWGRNKGLKAIVPIFLSCLVKTE